MNAPGTIRIYFDQQNFELGVKNDTSQYRARICMLTLRDVPDKYAFKIVGPNPISDLSLADIMEVTRILNGFIATLERFTDGRALYCVQANAGNSGELAPITLFAGERIVISAFDELYECTIPQAIETQALMQLLTDGYMTFTKVI